MAYTPQAFLLDEPLSNLDARLRLEARTFLKRLQRDLGITTVFVTHDQAEALALADRIAVMQGGRIRQVGTPVEVFRRPANTFVAGFIGSTPMNLLDATIAGDEVLVAGVRVPLPGHARGFVAEGEEVTFAVRPEYLDYSRESAGGAIPGEVVVVENLGSSSLVSLDLPDGAGTMQVVVQEGAEPEPGDHGWAIPRPDRALLYRDGELVAETPAADAPSAGAPTAVAATS
jgi:multiple sugar transport system ATP-binding protein